jgi:hypothetical protein
MNYGRNNNSPATPHPESAQPERQLEQAQSRAPHSVESRYSTPGLGFA